MEFIIDFFALVFVAGTTILLYDSIMTIISHKNKETYINAVTVSHGRVHQRFPAAPAGV